MGILANGEIFPANNPSPSYTLISKVEKDPDQFCYFVKECFGQEVSVLDHFNKSWSTGIPLYNHTLLQSQKVLRENREMALWGNYVDKISLRELLVKPWQAV